MARGDHIILLIQAVPGPMTLLYFTGAVAGLHESLQPCSRAARKWRENEEMKRKWRENEEIERKWRENKEMDRE